SSCAWPWAPGTRYGVAAGAVVVLAHPYLVPGGQGQALASAHVEVGVGAGQESLGARDGSGPLVQLAHVVVGRGQQQQLLGRLVRVVKEGLTVVPPGGRHLPVGRLQVGGGADQPVLPPQGQRRVASALA